MPASLLERSTPSREIWTVSSYIAEYLRHNTVPLSDVKLRATIRPQMAAQAAGHLDYEWAEGWVRAMKRGQNLSPSTRRHRHGALARCFDWITRKHPDILAQHPLRLLKRGFAVYTADDAAHLVTQGKTPKIEEERDRRRDEQAGIRKVLELRPVETAFFTLALETAKRRRECNPMFASCDGRRCRMTGKTCLGTGFK